MSALKKRTREAILILGRLGRWRKKGYTVSLVFVSGRESQRLNARFRKKDRPANVLSFDYGSSGEIVLAPKLIRNQARVLGQSFSFRLLGLVVHGLLHLAGLDHEGTPRQARAFEQVERYLLQRLEIYPPGPKSKIKSKKQKFRIDPPRTRKVSFRHSEPFDAAQDKLRE